PLSLHDALPIYAGREAALGLPQVADPGHRALIEQGIADRAAWIVGTEIAQEQLAVEMLSEDVGPETREARIRARTRVAHQLEHRAVELDDLETVGADHQPRPSPRAPRALPGSVDAPRAGHAQMRVKRQVALEAQEQVL